MKTAYLEITLDIDDADRSAAAGVYAKYKQPFLDTISGALSKELLLRGDGEVKVGTPTVDGATVTGTVLAEGRHRKVIVFKKKRRKQYRRTKGHRQDYTEIRIDKIAAGE